MKKKVLASVQSNYIPWRGYFDLINMADEFILYDDVQYTRKDWRNRNRIKTPQGPIWLTIPVHVKGKYHQKIREVVISDPRWPGKHWKSIAINYAKARYFSMYHDQFEELYLTCTETYLSRINYQFLSAICQILAITTPITWIMDYDLTETGKTEKIVEMCKKSGADEYIVGPSAKNYIHEELFLQENIALTFMDYSDYPEYQQLYPPFDPYISIIDLIFNEGPSASSYLKSF